jgi:D-inositol-3-phosphate glycosyltransferase
MVRVLIFGTHPTQYNGYAKVLYELVKRAHGRNGIEMGIFGFQAYSTVPGHRDDLPQGVFVYDAWANEEPKHQGFGIEQVQKVVAEFKPDVCIVYNDLMIVTTIVDKLFAIPDRKFKIVTYIDQVYLNQKRAFLATVNEKADAAILFTEHWRKVIVGQGLTVPTYVLEHGFDTKKNYKVPRDVARTYLGLSQDDFIILNLNRNQPRKRWDTCLKAFAEIVSRMPTAPVKLIIATAVQGSWDLIEIFERELKKRGLKLEDGMKHIIVLDNPQKMSDFDINVLYNVADIGINTCDGEGFGLCNFEQAAIGVPQVVTKLGGFLDFFDDSNSMLVDPSLAYYVDSTRDSVGGEALMTSYTDVVIAIEAYYNDRDLLKAHGKACMESIPAKYDWAIIANKFINIIETVEPPPPPPPPLQPILEIVDISVISNAEFNLKPKKIKKKGKKNRIDKTELLRMKEQIEKMLVEHEE